MQASKESIRQRRTLVDAITDMVVKKDMVDKTKWNGSSLFKSVLLLESKRP